MQKDCTCQGINENCYRCFGRGYYDDNDLKQSYSADYTSYKKKPDTGADDFLTKPLYSADYTSYKKESYYTNYKKVKCRYCKDSVRSNGMKRHINKVHGQLVSPITNALPQNNPVQKKLSPNSDKQYSADKPNKVLIKCTYCKSSVRSDRMKRHINKVHGQPSSTSKKRIPQSTSKRISFSSEHNDYTQKKIEGSTGFHVFRDHGEFGSFPSFDSMDDESSP